MTDASTIGAVDYVLNSLAHRAPIQGTWALQGEAAAQRVGDLCNFDGRKCDAAAIRALRRAAPTEDRS